MLRLPFSHRRGQKCLSFDRPLITSHFPRLPSAAAGRNYQKIQKAICSGFFFHAARKDAQEGYKTGGLWLGIRGLRPCCHCPHWFGGWEDGI